MDLSYNAVASKCAAQMARYQECVLANQNNDWQTLCASTGRALTECADAAVPHLRELKAGCAIPIEEYRRCLDTNGALPDEEVEKRCGGLMKRVWECSEGVMKDIEAREGKGTTASGEGRIV